MITYIIKATNEDCETLHYNFESDSVIKTNAIHHFLDKEFALEKMKQLQPKYPFLVLNVIDINSDDVEVCHTE